MPPACPDAWGCSSPVAGASISPCWIPASPFLRPIKVHLNSSTILQHISYFSQFCVIYELAEGYSALSSRLLVKIVNRIGPSIDRWGMLIVSLTLYHWTPLSGPGYSNIVQSVSLSAHQAHVLLDSPWGSHRKQCQRAYWSQGGQ